MSVKTILVDFDDVLSNLIETCLGEFNKKFRTSIELRDIDSWDMDNAPDFRQYFHGAIESGGIYGRATPNKPMLNFLENLDRERYQVVVVTAHPAHCGRGLNFKYQWLERHAPWIDVNHMVVCRNKTQVSGDLLIDDKAETCEKFWAAGRAAILYPRPWNSNGSLYHEGFEQMFAAWSLDQAVAEEYANSKPANVTPTAGLRYDAGKPDTSLLQWPALLEVAKVASFGAQKYDRHNWLKGMKWSKVSAPMMRHIIKFEMGQNKDLNDAGEADKDHSGLYHTAHIAWNALTLLTYQILGIGEDDRAKEYANALDRTSNKQ